MKLLLPIVVVLVAIVAGVGIIATSESIKPATPEPIPPSVRVVTVIPESVQLEVTSQGTVLPNTESELIAEVSGRVVWVAESLREGGFFEAGSVLLRLDPKDMRASVKRAQAAVERSSAELELASFEHERLTKLVADNLVSVSQLEAALRSRRVAQAAFEDAEVALTQAETDLGRTEIRAPFTGLVRKKNVDVGQFANRGSLLATLYANDLVEVRLPIADRQLAYLNLPLGHWGTLPEARQPAVTLSANYAGRNLEWEGEVVRTDAQIDTASRMVQLIARVQNRSDQPPLSVGLFVNASIEGLTADNTVTLPRTALHNDDQVLVVDEENRLHFRDVETLRLYKDLVYIKAGLKAGERVCISPLQSPVEGTTVAPVDQNTGLPS